MPYDVSGEPPRSVELQRRLEKLIEKVRAQVTPLRLVAFGLLGLLWQLFGASGTEGEAGGSSASVASYIDSITLAEVVHFVEIALLICAATIVIMILHELCHWVAFRHFGVQAFWTLTWVNLGGYNLYPLIWGGYCWPRFDRAGYELSYREDAIVSMAPLALSAVIAAGVVSYHLAIEPLGSLWSYLFLVLITTGPSPPDYAHLLKTPRERWEELEELERAVVQHRSAHGYPQAISESVGGAEIDRSVE